MWGPLLQRSVVIDMGVVDVLKGQLPNFIDSIVHRRLTGSDGLEELF